MRLALVPLLSACAFDHGRVGGDAGVAADAPDAPDAPIGVRIDAAIDAPIDAAIDAPIDAAPSVCYGPGSGAFRICLANAPTAPFIVTGGFVSYNTTQCNGGVLITPPTSPELCVVPATSVMIGATLSITGSRPLVLLSTGTISLFRSVTVAGGRDPSACNASTSGGGAQGGGGGGGGGSFGTKGGNGGRGDGSGSAGSSGNAALQPVNVLRGGCSGGPGGTQSLVGDAGNAGASGGALYLLANTIAILNDVDASGVGGGGGPTIVGGGGGGGSGGMIALYAPTIAISGRLVANGGAGGEGADTNDAGAAGTDPDPQTPTVPATCPNGVSGGGLGGSGAAGTTNPTAGANDNDGGGGGGGGHGVIRILSGQSPTATGGVFSPAPS